MSGGGDGEDVQVAAATQPASVLVRFSGSTPVRVVLPLFGFGLGTVASTHSQDLRAGVFGVALPFALVVAVWLVLLVLSVVAERRRASEESNERKRLVANARKETAEQTTTLLSAIHRSPNLSLIKGYGGAFEDFTANLTNYSNARDAIVEALERIVEWTAQFSGRNRRGYGANIMVVQAPTNEGAGALSGARLRFFDHRTEKFEGLHAILYAPAEVILSGTRRRILSISLPVPAVPQRNGRTLALPGAPYALLTGTMSVFEDSSRLAPDYCNDFSASKRDEVARYFSDGGDGADIGSLLSVRIGTDEEPIGVLNLDHSEQNLLGDDPMFYPTYQALLTPVLQLLRQPVREYAKQISERPA